MELSDKLTVDLKSEYKAQKEIFNILKEQYKEKVVKLESQLRDAKSGNDEPSSAWSTFYLKFSNKFSNEKICAALPCD